MRHFCRLHKHAEQDMCGTVSHPEQWNPIILIYILASIDFNKSLGRGKKDFFKKKSNISTNHETSWLEYLDENLTGAEDNKGSEDEIPFRSGQSLTKKPEINFRSNSNGEPLLPSDCLTMKLDDKKHVMWCFLKAHYGTDTFCMTRTLVPNNHRDCKRSPISRTRLYTAMG
jgi:hypothetical protein